MTTAASGVRRYVDTYIDSVLLLAGTRAMLDTGGISWATAVMATPANLEALRDEGVSDPQLADASASDVVLVVRGDETAVGPALAAGDDALFGERAPAGATGLTPALDRDLADAAHRLPGANVAIVSVPGAYAALEAHKALRAGLDVLLFSDNVPVEDEIELKEHAALVGRLVMGPGAGTAALGGCGLGFANVVRPGRVGVVAAAGTGAQEAMSLLDRWGEGVTQVIGVGGRDLSAEVGGRMAALAVRALDRDPATEIILLVSKPPSPAAARAVVDAAGATPIVAALVGLAAGTDLDGATAVARTLEGGVHATLGGPGPTPTGLRCRAPQRGRAESGRPRPGERSGSGCLLGGHALLRGPDGDGAMAGSGVVEHSAGQALRSASASGKPHLPRPGRGGVHEGPAPSDDRPRSETGDPARSRP